MSMAECGSSRGHVGKAEGSDQVGALGAAGDIVGAEEILIGEAVILEHHPLGIEFSDGEPTLREKFIIILEKITGFEVDLAIFELHEVDRAAGKSVREAVEHRKLRPFDVDFQEIDMRDPVGFEKFIAGGDACRDLGDRRVAVPVGGNRDRVAERAVGGIVTRREIDRDRPLMIAEPERVDGETRAEGGVVTVRVSAVAGVISKA